MKTLLLVLILTACGTDDSGTAPQASPSPSSPASVTGESKTQSENKLQQTSESPKASSAPVASATPTPSSAPTKVSAALIVTKAYQNAEWSFNFTGMTLSTWQTTVLNARVNVTRKLANGTVLTCSFKPIIFDDVGSEYGVIHLEFLAAVSDPNCTDGNTANKNVKMEYKIFSDDSLETNILYYY